MTLFRNCLFTFILVAGGLAAQTAPSKPTELAALVAEAERNSAEIGAAQAAWKSAQQMPAQVGSLPDPQLTLQQFSVGSPRPFAGFTNSDFAYVGVGVSQDLPYPGKLRLRAEEARRAARVTKDAVDAVRRRVRQRVSTLYYELAYIQETLRLLQRNQSLLQQVERVAVDHYRVGEGGQSDVLRAQVQQTKLLRDLATQREERGRLQAALRQVLNRPADAPPIIADTLTETHLPLTTATLQALVLSSNPDLQARQDMVSQQTAHLAVARKDLKPDFNAQYMYQRTGPRFRDYYMLTLGVRLPLHHRKQSAEIGEAVADLDRARQDVEVESQQVSYALREQVLAAETGERLLRIYRDGLLPQAHASVQSSLAAYAANRLDLSTVLGAYLDQVQVEQEYWRTLAGHESALSRVEELTGVSPVPGAVSASAAQEVDHEQLP
ncbi:MAG: TolC family protein [Terriglobales bacterium]